MSLNQNDCCFNCGMPVVDDDPALCQECTCANHLGSCSGVSEKTFKSGGEVARKQWRCQFCRGVKQKMTASNGNAVAIAELQVQVRDLKDTVTAIEKSVQLLSDKYDTVLASLNRNDREIKDIKCRIEEGRECQCNEQLTDFKRDIDEIEWQNRKLNLEFHGIPKTDHEVLLEKVNAVASSLELPPLGECDVTAMHRLPARSDRVPGIIVRFCRQSVRNKWLERRRQLRSQDSTVYIQENLAKQARCLLWETKQWARERKFSFVWFNNGKVLVRRKEGDRAIVVRSKNDLASIT